MKHSGISQSALTVFRDCPVAYNCYKERKDAIFFNQSSLDTGGYVHEAIDTYYTNNYLTKGTSDDILSLTYSNLKNKWDITLPVEEFKKAYLSLQNHALWEAKNISDGISSKPLTEVKIGEEGFYGIIDYIDLNNNKAIDWKTGRYPSLSFNYRVQAQIYKILFENKFNQELKNFYFFFLPVNEWRVVNFDKEKQMKVAEEVACLKQRIDKAINDSEFLKEPRTSGACKSCQYKLYCKLGGKKTDD